MLSWAGLLGLGVAGLMVVGSHVSCEVRGREGCLRQTAEPLLALAAGGGLLFTHSPGEGAAGAIRSILRASGRGREDGPGDEPGPPVAVAPLEMTDPREVYAGGRRRRG